MVAQSAVNRKDTGSTPVTGVCSRRPARLGYKAFNLATSVQIRSRTYGPLAQSGPRRWLVTPEIADSNSARTAWPVKAYTWELDQPRNDNGPRSEPVYCQRPHALVTQLGECRPLKAEVVGSIPTRCIGGEHGKKTKQQIRVS